MYLFMYKCPFSSHSWRWGTSTGFLHQQWSDTIQRVGHSWSGEVWRASRRLLYPGAVCHHHVWRDLSSHLQERSQLASWFGPRLWKHSHCTVWEQSRRERPQSESKGYCLSQKEKFASKITMIPSSFALEFYYYIFILCSTMTSVPRAITISRNLFYGWHGNWLEILI